MFDPERAASRLNSYQDVLKSDPDAREITQGMPLIRDQRNALLQEITQNGFAAGMSNGAWYVRLPEEGEWRERHEVDCPVTLIEEMRNLKSVEAKQD